VSPLRTATESAPDRIRAESHVHVGPAPLFSDSLGHVFSAMQKRQTVPALAAVVLSLGAHAVSAQSPAPLESIRNWQEVSEGLSSSGQIGYDQIPLLVDEGFDVVINLAIADEARNGQEGFLVAESGLTYVHIPVDWEEPELTDVEMFFDVKQANADRKVYVHCFANMRASAFVYMYRTLVEGVPEATARGTMNEVWDPDELDQWGDLIRRAQASLGR